MSELPPFEPYFAEYQESLEGLSTHTLYYEHRQLLSETVRATLYVYRGRTVMAERWRNSKCSDNAAG